MSAFEALDREHVEGVETRGGTTAGACALAPQVEGALQGQGPAVGGPERNLADFAEGVEGLRGRRGVSVRAQHTEVAFVFAQGKDLVG